MADVTNIKVEAADYKWSAQNLTKLLLNDLDTGGKHLLVNSALDAIGFYIWYDEDNGSLDPAPAGKTGIEVDYSAGDSAAVKATATALAINTVAGSSFNAAVDAADSNAVIIQNVAVGTTTASVDVDTAYTVTTELVGSDFDLGFTDGETAVALSEDLLDIVTQQTGTAILERYRTGKNIDAISIPMKESTAAKLKVILDAGGDSFTPAGGTEVTGWGSSKDFSGVFVDSRKLIIHPKRLAVGDLSEDLTFWRAYPMLENLNFSGDAEQLITVSFSILPDCFIDERISLLMKGDHTQNLLR